ncbi:MAG TPA: hypothetical protein VFS37_02660 [Conexibacter sp.]|nr:hypothetical protein [Conexibacter sp.]
MSAVGVGASDAAQAARATLAPQQLAWLAAPACALLTVLLVALLGPPLGDAFLGPGPESFWPRAGAVPEPEEHGRYLLSLVGPALLAAAILLAARRPRRLDARLARAGTLAAQLLLVGFIAACFLAQYDVGVSAYRPQWEAHVRYFTPATLAVALALPAVLLALLQREALAARIAALVRETRGRRIAALAAAVLLTVAWLLTAVDADSSIANTATGVAGHILWSLDEPFAILNGRTPLADFHSQYGQLIPYAAAAAMALFGASLGVFSLTMTTLSGLALLAVFALLRRIVRSSLVALVLWAPFLATGFFMKIGPLDDRYGPANLYSLWPIRYGGPYLVAWLLARHVDGAGPRRPWALFLVAGLTLANNPEFGAGAVAALAVALVAVRPPRSRAAAARLAAEAAGGLAAALLALVLLTLVRSGSLPHLGWALEFSRLYGVGGWALVLMPRLGIFLAVYVTFAAALALAAVRMARRAQDTVLTAALAWSGMFGLVAGGYFAGRSHPQVLIDLFSPWALALVLLTIAAGRALAARDWRRPQPAELAVLFGFGLLVCSLAQTPTPWSQLSRIRDDSPTPLFKQRIAAAFVAERTQPGEKVLLLMPLGHRVAYDTGRVNVGPYASIESMPTRQQLDRAIDVLRREGGDRLFLSTQFTFDEELDAIQRAGFAAEGQVQDERGEAVVAFADRGG